MLSLSLPIHPNGEQSEIILRVNFKYKVIKPLSSRFQFLLSVEGKEVGRERTKVKLALGLDAASYGRRCSPTRAREHKRHTPFLSVGRANRNPEPPRRKKTEAPPQALRFFSDLFVGPLASARTRRRTVVGRSIKSRRREGVRVSRRRHRKASEAPSPA